MFAIGIEFITGTAVMTSADSREVAEWPPHPARVFMALVAAYYESRPLLEDGAAAQAAWETERKCLEWLEQQPPPSLSFSDIPKERRRTVAKFYVPVNDTGLPLRPEKVKDADLRDALGVMPAFRSKQERTFPAVSPGIDAGLNQVHLIWDSVVLPDEFKPAFKKLTSKVVRIGHSSSLVIMWIGKGTPSAPKTLVPSTDAKSNRAGVKLRGMAPGLLQDLDTRFNADDIDLFFQLGDEIRGAKGKAKDKSKEDFKNHFGEDWSASSAAPVRLRPFVGISHAYHTPQAELPPPLQTIFDSDILILSKLDGRVLGLESTNLLLDALRGALLTGSENSPAWFTGHKFPGKPADMPHLAMFPLAFIDSEYADGHLLGLALAFPRSVNAQERSAELRRLLFNEHGEDREIKLTLGNLGEWTLQREDRNTRPAALRPGTWTQASTVWATVTPIVLDRHSKFDPADPKERDSWRNETADIIRASCAHIGLPVPTAVDIDKTSWHRGAPRSRPGPSGMPWFSGKSNGARQQVHALLQFDCEVQGPVLLGAGRYRGYGLCKPLGFPAP